MPSANRQDYKDKDARVKAYDDALQNFNGNDYNDFMSKYGHLLDDDDELPGENKKMGQINEAVKEIGQDKLDHLLALADDDDELDLFME